MPPEAKEIQQVNEAITALRDELKKVAPDPEKMEKMNQFLDTYEETNQKATIELQNSLKANEDLKERMDVLELELVKTEAGNGKHYREGAEYKALQQFAIVGKSDLTADEIKALRTDSGATGAYLVPSEMDTEITKTITEISGIRAIARVRTISAKTLEMPIRTSIPTATFEGEAEAGGDSQSGYSNEQITAFRQTFTTPITMDMLMDAAFNMESEILGDASEAFAVGEGTNFVTGTGNKTPEGFLNNTAIDAGALISAASGVVDATDVILLTGELKVGYNPTYVMNRKTLAQLRTLKSTTGAFLWQPGMNGPVAATINGFPYIIAQAMPDIASNSKSVAFGDFRRGYTIVDRTGMSVIRDDLTQKKNAIVEFTFNRWLTGQVTLAEAITVLKTAP